MVSLDDQNAPSFCKLTLHPQPQTAGQTSFLVGTTPSHNSSTAKAQTTPNAAAPKSSTSPEGTSQTTATTHRRARIHRNRTRIPPAVVVTAQTPQRRTRQKPVLPVPQQWAKKQPSAPASAYPSLSVSLQLSFFFFANVAYEDNMRRAAIKQLGHLSKTFSPHRRQMTAQH